MLYKKKKKGKEKRLGQYNSNNKLKLIHGQYSSRYNLHLSLSLSLSLSLFLSRTHARTHDLTQLVKHRTVTSLMQVRFPGAARDFLLPKVHCQCRLSFGVRTPPYATALCINIYTRVKDPVVHCQCSVDHSNINIPSTRHSDEVVNLLFVIA